MTNHRFVAPGWASALAASFESDSYASLTRDLIGKYANGEVIFPRKDMIFRALRMVDLPDVKVVIIGQDPYHGPGQATGLAFGTDTRHVRPPTLRNIFRELEADLDRPVPDGGTLTGWAEQGVLLLNSVLTVQQGSPGSHAGLGWERFTDDVIKVLDRRVDPVVFVLWGRYAADKGALINRRRHAVLTGAHPSPQSAHNFYGCRHFSETNKLLVRLGKQPIDWLRIDQAAPLDDKSYMRKILP